MQDYRLTGRPADKLFGTLRFRSEHNDNKTPTVDFGASRRTTGASRSASIENDQWGMNSTNLGLDLNYELTSNADVTLLGEHPRASTSSVKSEGRRERVRCRPALPSPVERRHDGQLAHGPARIDSFLGEDYLNAAGIFIEPAGLRRYDVADRDQNMASG